MTTDYFRIYSANVCPAEPNDAPCEPASITVLMDGSEEHAHPNHPASLADAYLSVNAHGWLIDGQGVTFHGTMPREALS